MNASVSKPPIVRKLPAGFCIKAAFNRLAGLPNRVWFDSASQPKLEENAGHVGRYSFLSADPIANLVAHASDPDPWPLLSRWANHLPRRRCDGLPPFVGGIAGVIGYEAGAWLEDIGIAQNDDLPTPAMSLGLYDWTIAYKHDDGSAVLVCNGLTDSQGGVSIESANARADQVMSLVADCVDTARRESNGRIQTGSASPANVASNFTSEQFQSAVAKIVQRIHAGDSFQVNLAQRLLRKTDETPDEIYLRLRETNPAPFGGFYDGGDFAVLSSSPEGFLNIVDGVVQTRPIKGTIRRTGDKQQDEGLARELRASAKDIAENVMIVDLMRNDLSRVCEDDSVVVRKLCEIEPYEYVQHLVSVVEGKLAANKTVVDLLRACFPGGSVTGAPKIEAMKTIAELEPNPRGPYCGSMGYISCCDVSDWNILIRTICYAAGYLQIPVGGGITARSKPAAEEAETWAKAEGMLRALVPKENSDRQDP